MNLNMPNGWLFITISICLCGLAARGESPPGWADYNTRVWQMEDGLPHNIVQAIAQTRDGYLWIGTREGLARFDGIHFQTIELLPERSLLSITALVEAKDGSLWIGTENAGLFRLSAGVIERCKTPNGAVDFDVVEIRESGDGAIWISSSGEALRWLNGTMERRAKLRRVQQGMCVDTNGAVWTVANALIRLDAKAATNSFPQSVTLGFVSRCVYCDPSGVFWIGDGDDLIQLKDGVVTNFHKPEGQAGYVSVIFRSHVGELWVGSYLGLRRFVDGKFIKQAEPGAPEYRIYAIFEDREQNLWVGSEEGLLRLTPKAFKTITKKDGLTGNTVASVCASRDGSVWINPWRFGLNHWVDGKITALSRADGLSSDIVMAMAEGWDGSLWVGTDNGGALNRIQGGVITIYGPKQGFIASPTTATTALYEDQRGILWIGSRELLQRWDGTNFSSFTTDNGISHKKINAICGGANDSVWIGTDGGLTRYSRGRFENLGKTDVRLRSLILSLYEDADNILWIGTKGHGLLRWKDGIVNEFTSSQGLYSDAIYSILEDNHANLWLNSSRGIFRVEKKRIEAVLRGQESTINSISYGKSEGVLSSGQYRDVTQPSACKDTAGRLWFRTTQGVAVVNPEEINANGLPPPVVLQEIIADKISVGAASLALQTAEQVTIRPGRGELEIRYAALSFRAPEKCQYRYKLEGLDLNWVDAGTRRAAFYNNLKPGKYRFQVTACNNDGVWNETGNSVLLTLQPHFWQTQWFVGALILASVGGVGGTVRYITRRRLQRRLALLEQQHAVEKERARIARDMHDELGAKLTRISFQGAMARQSAANPPETDQHISKMSETARELVLSLDQIVWAVDPENDSLESLANYICRYASEFFESGPIYCKFSIPRELPPFHLSTEVRHNVFLAVKEALNNALKHSGATRVLLTIFADADKFTISIADDGRGAEIEGEPGRNKRMGHGLGNMRERLASIGGKFEFTSRPENGTEVSFVVPLSAESGRGSYVYPTGGATSPPLR